MNLSKPILELLADKLKEDLEDASSGHCLRVDDLHREDAEALCRALRTRIDQGLVDVFILAGTGADREISIPPEKAVELRNRKKRSMCLFVPSGMVDATASSLANSFSVFDLKGALRSVSSDLLGQIPEDMRILVNLVKTVAWKSKIAIEDWADFLASICSGRDGAPAVGRELWRAGLIPDVGPSDMEKRIEHNAEVVRKLVHPTRAQASPVERVNSLGVREGDVRDSILEYLSGKRLRDAKTWLEGIASPPWCDRISFHLWAFEDSGESNLESIEVTSFLGKDGQPETWSNLRLQKGIGSPVVAQTGPKGKVGVKWSLVPASPTNIVKWRIELIPSKSDRLHGDVEDVDLPRLDVPVRNRRATLPLDVDHTTTKVDAVQIRITGLGENGLEIRRPDGEEPVEGLSDEFWLTTELAPPEEDRGESLRRATVSNIPLGRLKACVDLNVSSLEETSWQWGESEPECFSLHLNQKCVVRVSLIPHLDRLERKVLAAPERLGRLICEVDRGQSLDPERAAWEKTTERDGLAAFVDCRRDVFRIISQQGNRGLVETCDWSKSLSEAIVAYASAYRRALSSAKESEAILGLLSVDTMELSIGGGQRGCRAILVMPTHPLRLLWFAAYVDLLKAWEAALLGVPVRQRKTLVDHALLSNVTPTNTPAFLISSRDGAIFPYAQDLQFFWGLALPVDAFEPSWCLSRIYGCLGIADADQAIPGFNAKRLAEELSAYQSIHPYLKGMRINMVNAGSGSGGIISEALRAFSSSGSDEADLSKSATIPRLEILSHVQDPGDCGRDILGKIQNEFYELQRSGKGSHLDPLFSLYVRPIRQAHKPPGGDVNLTVVMDKHRPQLGPSSLAWQESTTFHGLISRFVSRFESSGGECAWRHSVGLGDVAKGAAHPVRPEYTEELLETHRETLRSVGRLLGSSDGVTQPTLNVVLTAEERVEMDRLHHISDWVISLDRFLGVELFDDPGDADLSSIARKYLLDYVPEFMEGLGRRMIVTTSHRSEIEEVLGRAMDDLGFGLIDESVGDVLDHLKTVSGRLAIRILGNEAQAKEAVSLGVVAAWLRAKGDLENTILIPVDMHPEMFGAERSHRPSSAGSRCDLIRIRLQQRSLTATFIEVKSRGVAGDSEDLMQRMLDQMNATEGTFRALFFSENPRRIDHSLQRAKLVNVMRFYLRRGLRYGLVQSHEEFDRMMKIVQALEHEEFDLSVEKLGFIVSLTAETRPPKRMKDAEIRFITQVELGECGLCGATGTDSPREDAKPSEAVIRTATEGSAGVQSEEGTEIVLETRQATSLPFNERISEDRNEAKETVVTDMPDVSPPNPPERICVPLGLSDSDKTVVEWRAGVKGSPHLFILGIPGQGKSVAVTRILDDLARQSLPTVVIDFHGQFGGSMRRHSSYPAPIVIDATKGMPFSPFEADATPGAETWSWKMNCHAVAEIFQHVCKMGEIQREVVYEALYECYKELGFEDGSPKGLPTTSDLMKKIESFQNDPGTRSVTGTRNVLPRCRPLLDFGLFQEPIPYAGSFEEMLKHGVVIDVHALGLETLQLAAGAFLLRKIYKDMFRWGEADRLRLAIVLDEAHRLAKDVTLPKIMKEGRKFGVVVIVASQGLSDFHQDVVGNAGTKIVFRTNHPQSKKVAGFLKAPKGVDLATEMEQLDIGQALIQSPDMPNAARVRMFGPA